MLLSIACTIKAFQEKYGINLHALLWHDAKSVILVTHGHVVVKTGYLNVAISSP
jgi:hypothetical protein